MLLLEEHLLPYFLLLEHLKMWRAARKRALLLHFGTAKAISRASLDDLQRTPGVNAATAKAVYDHFHG